MFRVGSCSSGSEDDDDDVWIKQNPENTPLLRTLHPYIPKSLIPRNRLSTPSYNCLTSASGYPEVIVRRTRKAGSENGNDATNTDTTSVKRRSRCRSAISAFEPGYDLRLDLDLGRFPCGESTADTEIEDVGRNTDIQTRGLRETRFRPSHEGLYFNSCSIPQKDTNNSAIISGAGAKSLKISTSETSEVKNSIVRQFSDFVPRSLGTWHRRTSETKKQYQSHQSCEHFTRNLLNSFPKIENPEVVQNDGNEFGVRDKQTIRGKSRAQTLESVGIFPCSAAGGVVASDISRSFEADLRTKGCAFREAFYLLQRERHYSENDNDGSDEAVHQSPECVDYSDAQKSLSHGETPEQQESKRTVSSGHYFHCYC